MSPHCDHFLNPMGDLVQKYQQHSHERKNVLRKEKKKQFEEISFMVTSRIRLRNAHLPHFFVEFYHTIQTLKFYPPSPGTKRRKIFPLLRSKTPKSFPWFYTSKVQGTFLSQRRAPKKFCTSSVRNTRKFFFVLHLPSHPFRKFYQTI